MEWPLAPGQEVSRRELHERLGGRIQGGISPSRVEPVIMLFVSTTASYEAVGLDGWGDDQMFHYTGEGMRGDQKLTQGNLAVLHHAEDGRSLHLFLAQGGGKPVTYVGEFELVHPRPWYWADASDTDGAIRSTIVFRLRPVGAVADIGPRLPIIPLETTEISYARPETLYRVRQPSPAEREADLTMRYRKHLQTIGHATTGVRIMPRGERRPLFPDLFDETDGRLIEVTASVSRDAVRLAIAKLLDYRRFLDPSIDLAVIVPTAPREDLIELCGSVGAAVLWPDEHGFVEVLADRG